MKSVLICSTDSSVAIIPRSPKREDLAEWPVGRASFTSLVTNSAHFPPLRPSPCLLPFHPFVPPPFGTSSVKEGKKIPARLPTGLARIEFSFALLSRPRPRPSPHTGTHTGTHTHTRAHTRVHTHTLGLAATRSFVTYGSYETMIKRARARRRVSARTKERKRERESVWGG